MTPVLVPYRRDPLAALAGLIISRYRHALPDLSRCSVLLPNLLDAPRLRRRLLEEAAGIGHRALLGPAILTLPQWLNNLVPPPAPPLSPQAQELILVETLNHHRGLFKGSDPWLLAGTLLDLFAQLTLQRATLPADLDAFIKRLSHAYRLGARTLSALSMEANLVHTLWHAWHRQLREEGRLDPNATYIRQLDSSLTVIAPDAHIFMAGHVSLTPPEQRWASVLAEQGQLTRVAQGELTPSLTLAGGEKGGGLTFPPQPDNPKRPASYPFSPGEKATMRGSKSKDSKHFTPPLPEGEGVSAPSIQQTAPASAHSDVSIGNGADPYTLYLDVVFASMANDGDHVPIMERAQNFAALHTANPTVARLLAYTAPDAESEARAVDIQVRRWLLQGKRRIAIVCDDRRLARRARALLERADVALHDASGWALSTTAAAAALERWLETLEEDFAYQPLTDLLKSPFAFPRRDRDELSAAVYRFEQDLVIHENIPRNLQRYRKHLTYRRARWPQAAGAAVATLLDDIEAAAKPLMPLLFGNQAQSPQRWLDALEGSLHRLGLTETFAADAAGQRILQELQVMHQALAGRNIKMPWREFRTWLGRTLERFNFQPPTAAAAVRLLGLEQSALTQCDALILAGATAQHLPGAGEPSPFFNEAVRGELGLPGFRQRYNERFYYFRRLLQAAPQVLITTRREENGEPVLASPWLEALQSFQRCAYDADLDDDELTALVNDPATQVMRGDSDVLPEPATMPTPSVPTALLPEHISANAYQQLMNCPYQFYVARCLQLTAPEAVREALEKSDYGQRIHLALHVFHSGADGYPDPFTQAITAANRDAAIRSLEEISQAVFAKDLEDNFMHRGWLHRWRQVIPQYIDWQIARAETWQVADTEIAIETQRDGITLKGRIDRLDRGAAGSGIVDYKTGMTPHEDAVLSGEEVQLPFYVLLAELGVQRVEYLSLDGHRFGSRAALEGERLQELIAENAERLSAIMGQLTNGAPLPAWGDEEACRFCAVAGVCRRETWRET